MIKERRKRPVGNQALHKGVPLPADFCKMVTDVIHKTFAEGIAVLTKLKSAPLLVVEGRIYQEEITTSLSLAFNGQLAATTIHASCDFDPKASAPKAEDLLGYCVDGIASVLSEYLDPKREDLIAKFVGESLSAFEEIPFDWTPLTIQKRQVFLKVDKSNPKLEKMADDFLEKNDPDFVERNAKEIEELERARAAAIKDSLPTKGKPPTEH